MEKSHTNAENLILKLSLRDQELLVDSLKYPKEPNRSLLDALTLYSKYNA
uniref:DUF1778 domain-containing protein n=1 Tax=Dulem virus 52 TaxID=3145763 RepID=A0AAU8B2N0_9VIRU